MNSHDTPNVRIHVIALPLVAWGLRHLVASSAQLMVVVGESACIAEAQACLDSSAPDIVLLDLDGESQFDHLTQLANRTKAHVLAITGTQDPLQQDRAIMAGARGVVNKREMPAILLKAIKGVQQGEVWIDRDATGRIFMHLVKNQGTPEQANPAHDRIANLTRRERQTVAALASDAAAPGKVIASRLNISEHTLRNHLTAIYDKLSVNNRVDLYAFAHRHGLTEPSGRTV